MPLEKPSSRAPKAPACPSRALTLTGRTDRKAGRKNTEYRNAAVIPRATVLPRSLNGGASEKFMLRNPMAVVRLVRNTGWRFILMASAMASRRPMPLRMY